MPKVITREIERNQLWQLREGYRGPRVHDWLLQQEFASPVTAAATHQQAISTILTHAFNASPYYRQLFKSLGIKKRHLRDAAVLRRIPALEKGDVKGNAERLRATHLLNGERPAGTTQTSGTTGQPTVVHHSSKSMGMFAWLKQRELRWFGYNPQGTLASIRPMVELPRQSDGSYLANGMTTTRGAWPYLGPLFKTGTSLGFNNTNDITEQVAFLERNRPDYLLMQSAGLENLAIQDIPQSVIEAIKGVQAISQTLTPNMRSIVEDALQTSVHQNYGLNEIGLVASRCEAGRYHVHAEHCWVEIVRPDGSLCEDGEQGKLLITSLSNSAMPMIRYDADDLAVATEGPCPCGRTLPSFGRVHGRYRRIAHLPPGTMQRWGSVQLSLHKLPPELKSSVRKYQALQDETGAFEVLIACSETDFPAIAARVKDAFANAHPSSPTPALSLHCTQRFHGEGSRKFQSFISSFTPEMDT